MLSLTLVPLFILLDARQVIEDSCWVYNENNPEGANATCRVGIKFRYFPPRMRSVEGHSPIFQ